MRYGTLFYLEIRRKVIVNFLIKTEWKIHIQGYLFFMPFFVGWMGVS